jgi:hypothetical protein
MAGLYGYIGKTILGNVLGVDEDVETRIAAVPIYAGDPLFAAIGDGESAYGAKSSTVKGTLNGTFTGMPTVALTVNGVALPAVSVMGAEAMLNALRDKVNSNAELQEQNVTAYTLPGEPLALYIEGEETVTATAVITDSSATLDFAAYSTRRFVGVARHTDTLAWKNSVGVYIKGAAVNVLTRGRIAVPLAEGADAADGKPAYVITAGDDTGKFTDAGTGNYDTGAIFRGEIETGIAYVEVRGSK